MTGNDAPAHSFRVIVSPRAERMLVAHAAFLAQVSAEAAESLTAAFEQAAGSLAEFPRRGAWLRGEFIPGHTYRYLVFQRRYLIIYQVREDTVYIDLVVDCRTDYAWLLP